MARADVGPILPLRFAGVGFAARGRTLLEGLDFELSGSHASFILGPNGAGKSLTLRLAHGLIRPTQGSLSWCGRPVSDARAAQAMVFQRPVLLRRSVAANVDYALKLQDVGWRERPRRVAEALALVGLEPLTRSPARVLSGGEQQRLALARAWALRPQVLLLDEPTASLDPAATQGVEEVIRAFRAQGTKVVMTSHDLGQVRRLADEVLFLHAGRLLEQSPAEVFMSAARSAEGRAYVRGDLLF